MGEVSTVLANLATVFLLWRQNKLFERQNEIFAIQAGLARPEMPSAAPRPPRPSWLKEYWPFVAWMFLALLTFGVFGYGYYQRHLSSVSLWKFSPLLLGLAGFAVIGIRRKFRRRPASQTSDFAETSSSLAPQNIADVLIEYSHDDRDRSPFITADGRHLSSRDRPLLIKNVTTGRNALNVRIQPIVMHEKLVFKPDIVTCIVGGGEAEVVPEYEFIKGGMRGFQLNHLPLFLNELYSAHNRIDVNHESLNELYAEKSIWLEIHYESDGKQVISECELLFKRWHEQIRTGAHRIRLAGQQRAASAVGGAPRLLCKGVSSIKGAITVYEDDMTSSPLVSTARVVGRPFFYHLKIANEPTGTIERKVAKKVAGRVQMFHENGTPAARERLHRWENSPGPREVGKSADQLVAIDIPPNGIECNLDIAMKYESEDSFYTPNNETAMRIADAPGWREEDFKFPPGIYIAKVHLSGINVVTDLRCQIVNKGVGSKLEITPLGD
jgi:hypothetical protein